MDKHDRQALRDAYREHQAAVDAFDEHPADVSPKEVRYYDTLQRLDEVCERLDLTYGDDVDNLEQLLEPQMSD